MIGLTKNYIKAFNDKNLEAVGGLLSENFTLCDPVVKKITGKKACLEVVKGIFESCENLSFKAKNIFQDKDHTFIEFNLKLDENSFEGVDILRWQNGKIAELRAYLDTKGV